MRRSHVWIAASLAVLAGPAALAAQDGGFCSTCEVQAGLGFTYHFWETTHSLVIPLALNFDEDRYEFAAFRFTGQQRYFDRTFNWPIVFAEPLWGFSLSRRLEFLRHRHWSLVAALGASYKTQENRQGASLWNFAWSGGVRIMPTQGMSIEVIGRHWSNAGLKLPNHGEDFATVTFSIYPSLFRHGSGGAQ